MKTDTKTLIKALMILSRDIQTDDGVVNACIAEAALRLQQFEDALKEYADTDNWIIDEAWDTKGDTFSSEKYGYEIAKEALS